MKFYLTCLMSIGLLLVSCSPKTKVSLAENSRNYSKVAFYEPFAFIEQSNKRFSKSTFIGQIEIKDGGFSGNCDYATTKAIAKSEAQKIGGNCLVIREHKKPNYMSTCHRIKADVYRIDNPKDFEKEILWHENRKLQVEDFKGSPKNKPYLAVTASTFIYVIKSTGTFSKDYTVEAHTYFNCELSYFKRIDLDDSTLAHEQIHFDITELYARLFLKSLKKNAKNIDEALGKSEAIMKRITKQLQAKQEAYDAEVFADGSKQAVWDQWIVQELKVLDAYKNKLINVKAR